MGKKVKIDGKNRVTITILKELGVLDKDDNLVEITPGLSTGLIHNPNEDIDAIIDSLEAHIKYFKAKKNKKENGGEEGGE